MHELPITQSILDIALRHAGNAKSVTKINLVIGDLSSVVGDSVGFYWDLLSKDTIAEGAILHFERIKTRFLCTACQNEYEPEAKEFNCPNCESDQVKILAGKEFQVESIEVE